MRLGVVAMFCLAGALAACQTTSSDGERAEVRSNGSADLPPEASLCQMDGPNDFSQAEIDSQAKIDACTVVLARGGPDELMGAIYGNRGLVYWRMGRVAEALADLSAAIRVFPDRPELSPNRSALYVNRGALYSQLGNDRLAEHDFRTAVDLDPHNPGAMNNLARLRLELGDYAAALELMDKALSLKSDFDVFYDTQAHALMGLGQIEAAATAFGRAAELGGPQRVYRYQTMLVAKGYDPGRGDGVLDAATQAALLACIRDNCRLMLD